MGKNIDIERINFSSVAPGTAKVAHTTRAANKRIIGLCLHSHGGDYPLLKSSIKLSVDKKEIFSSDFNPSLIAFSQDTPVNERFYNFINEAISQSEIEIEWTTLNTSSDTFSLLLKCEQND